VLPGFDDDFEIRFDEVIAERSGGGLENLVLVAPRPEETDVNWKRSRVTAKPKGGWHPDVVYHVQVLPGFADLRNNILDTAITIVFTTGGAIPETSLEGTVVDWEGGRVAASALVEAVLLPDSLTYFTAADSVGQFSLTSLPIGDYLLLAAIDQNNSRTRDSREAFDSVSVRLDSAISHVFWTFAHDTVGPRLAGVGEADSMTIRVSLSQKLHPEVAPTAEVFLLPDSTAVPVAAIWSQEIYDSVSAVEQATADSLAQLVADSIAAAADSLGADSVVTDTLPEEPVTPDTAVAEPTVPLDSAMAAAADSAAADSTRLADLLALRPNLTDVAYIRIEAPLVPGARYLVAVSATNLSNAVLESQMPLITEAPPDSTEVPPDSAEVPPDST
jgi:hypothetical protein